VVGHFESSDGVVAQSGSCHSRRMLIDISQSGFEIKSWTSGWMDILARLQRRPCDDGQRVAMIVGARML